MLALDEPQPHDRQFEVKGLRFVLDPFAASHISQVEIEYDEFEDDFTVRVPDGPQSSC
ncbi:hypothetical protein [Effusibacillus pohliae]|uniref:hypothetical protein n=1 Tax=Effusibacillus pohliae TaxID=232270 RepID=UPI00035C4D94|nr:hypothetical protein [Effusibacillus pohliae]